jgi:hypothetical protein
MNISERCEMAMQILRRTGDGDGLDARDLYLVESAVNGFLTEAGYEKFTELHKQVVDRAYRLPWLHGIEHLTIDQVGYVYWKDQQVEHYDIPWAYGEEAGQQARELARKCKILEAAGKKVSTNSAIWAWEEEGS